MPNIIGVKFKPAGKIYYFSSEKLIDSDNNYIPLKTDDAVIVETANGLEYGKVALTYTDIDDSEVSSPLKPAIRIATKEDEKQVERNAKKAKDARKVIEEKIKKFNLDMKITDIEYTFTGNKLIFYFTSENRVDFRELVKELAAIFKTRIELRQIGIRDQSKTLGGIAPCGRACCCSYYLSDFERVSIKMAKVQGLSLNPAKISGLCGRLMCCLSFENEHYSETAKEMPKINTEVKTPDGKGNVLNVNMLTKMVTVKIIKPEGAEELKDFPVALLKWEKKKVNSKAEDDDEPLSDEIKELLD